MQNRISTQSIDEIKKTVFNSITQEKDPKFQIEKEKTQTYDSESVSDYYDKCKY